MTLKNRLDLIDKLNAEFINVMSKASNKDYNDYYKRFNKELEQLVLAKDKVTKGDISRIAKSIGINDSGFIKSVQVSFILSALTGVIEKEKLTRQEKAEFAPILAIVGLYSITRPKALARAISNVTTAINKKSKANLTDKEKRIYNNLNGYYNKNAKAVKSAIVENKKHIVRINKVIKSSTSKRIFKRYRVLNSKTISQDVVAETLTKEFGEQNKARVERIVRTELKTQTELVKQTHFASLGYVKKKWNTQGDGDVRESHRVINGKVIAINKKFRLKAMKGIPAAWALFPGDPSLPIGQRINERCFLSYLK